MADRGPENLTSSSLSAGKENGGRDERDAEVRICPPSLWSEGSEPKAERMAGDQVLSGTSKPVRYVKGRESEDNIGVALINRIASSSKDWKG